MILADSPPTPDKASLIRFLLTCPMLQRLSESAVEPLASQVQMKRYADGADLIDQLIAHRDMPLCVVVHGQASWEPSNSTAQRGAWMLTSGSMFGLGAVNDWAHAHGVAGTWPTQDLVMVRCKAAGPLWVLELAPQRFDAVFSGARGHAICSELLCMFATVISAPAVVAALRQMPQFARVTQPKLYRLLERAPTLNYGPEPELLEREQPQQQLIDDAPQAVGLQGNEGNEVTGPALYYVLEGELEVNTSEQLLSLSVGEIGSQDLFTPSSVVATSAAQAASTARAVVLTQRALNDMIRSDPGFARSLGPRAHGEVVSP